MRPLIGITPDGDAPAGAPTEAEYRVRMNYAGAVQEAGGCPIILPWLQVDVDDLTERCDGILITGGTPGVSNKEERNNFERALIRAALDRSKPVLGICNGMQLLGQMLGADFVDSIAATVRDSLDHIPWPVPIKVAHPVALAPGTRLHHLACGLEPHVNSLHRQAIAGSGDFTVSARAPDGVIEAIEGKGRTFAMGLQWHPEYRITALDRAIIAAFVDASHPAANRVYRRDRFNGE